MPTRPKEILRECHVHGETVYRLIIDKRYHKGSYYRCLRCRGEHSTRRQKRIKQLAIDSLGGSCVVCGYNGCDGALEFHHTNPNEKGVTEKSGITRVSAARMKEELKKCVLVCANCHREIHAGLHPHLIIPV